MGNFLHFDRTAMKGDSTVNKLIFFGKKMNAVAGDHRRIERNSLFSENGGSNKEGKYEKNLQI